MWCNCIEFVFSFLFQAVGIFGHMTANSPLQGGGNRGGKAPIGGGEGENAPNIVDSQHAPGDSKAFLQDLDKKLSDFDGAVESALEKSSFKGRSISSQEETPHFTIKDSPTRSVPMSELDKTV